MILIIGGSQAYSVKDRFGKILEKIVIDTPFGISNPIYRIASDRIEFLLMSRHGEYDYDRTAPFVNYRANIYAAKFLGVERIISWTGPGSINKNFLPGDFVIPDDLIDVTKSRKYTFFEWEGIGFIRQYPVFCPEIRKELQKTLENLEITFHTEGTYACTEGPRLETPGEITMLKNAGADIVGMTIVPEVFLAKELEICYATLCYVTNFAEGMKKTPFKAGILFEGMASDKEMKKVEKAVSKFPEIMTQTVKNLYKRERKCPCKNIMERYRLKGEITHSKIFNIGQKNTPIHPA